MPSSFTVDNSSSQNSRVLLVVLLVISLVCVIAYGQEGDDGALHHFQAGVSATFLPAKAVSGGISSAEQGASDQLSNATADDATLTGLRQQNEQLRNDISELEQYREEAQQLQNILHIHDSYQLEGTTAHVLSRPSEAWDKQITLDKGSDDGIRNGLAVVSGSGLVGQVTSVSGSSSQVRPITDSSSGVSAMVQSSHDSGILRGSFDGLLYLEGLDDSAQVSEGDVIVTSGAGGVFPRGIMIGTVISVEDSQGAQSRKITVSPNAQVDTSDVVMVITSMGNDGDAQANSSSSLNASNSNS